jgi:hypothetical protein
LAPGVNNLALSNLEYGKKGYSSTPIVFTSQNLASNCSSHDNLSGSDAA